MTKPPSQLSPCIILAKPQMGENIGATARAMANFGLTDLRLIAPRDGWPNPKAEGMSTGAFEHLAPVQVFDTLKDAAHDCHALYATTARPRDMVKPVLAPRAAMQEARAHMGEGQKVGFVFGGEQSGMDNDDLALCGAIVQVPTNPEFSSLNLAQAVLLVVSQFAEDEVACAPRPKDSPPATKEELFAFLDRLESELEAANFFKAEGLKPTMVRNIQNIFTRNDLSEQEVRTLQGILSALTKA